MNYRPEIDGLRAVAVLLVFIFHLFPLGVTGGFIGVDVFFVISGFLITNIILKKINKNQFSFLDFYTRRIQRIFPALFALLFFTAIIATLTLGSEDYLDFFKAFRYSAGQISNFLFSQNTNYFQAGHKHSPLLHTWSLGVEEQFYLLWPLLLFLLTKFKNVMTQKITLLLICLISFAISQWLALNDPKNAFYMVHSRIWELGLGGLLAYNISFAFSKRASGLVTALGLILIVASGFILTSTHSFPGVNALAPVLGSVFVILFTQGNSVNIAKSLLMCRPMVFVGKISYSLYLWHWPLIAFTKKYTQTEITYPQATIIVILSFLLSYISWKFIENPFRKPSTPSAGKKFKILAVGFGLIVFSIILSNGLKGFSHSPWRYTTQPPYEKFKMHDLHSLCTPDRSENTFVPNPKCTSGPNTNKPDTIIFGDSHASHFYPAFINWAAPQNKTVQLVAASSCPPLFGNFRLFKNNEFIKRCTNFSRKVENYILNSESITTVVLAMRAEIFTETNDPRDLSQKFFLTSRSKAVLTKESSRQIFKEQLEYTIQLLLASGKKVILMKQVPMLKKDPLKCIESLNVLASKFFPLNSSHCFEFDNDFVSSRLKYSDDLFDEMRAKFSITVFNSREHIKAAKADDEFLYYDDDHLNEMGAQKLSQYFNF